MDGVCTGSVCEWTVCTGSVCEWTVCTGSVCEWTVCTGLLVYKVPHLSSNCILIYTYIF